MGLFNREKYKTRLIDKEIEKNFSVFRCLLIEGPKWCGKTWTSKYITNKSLLLTNNDEFNLIKLDPDQIFKYEINDYPILIDEWQEIPELWNKIRNRIDEFKDSQKFILTGSTSINDMDKNYNGPKLHSGAGRIARIKMYTMSLYESGDSEGLISIEDMINNKKEVFKKLKIKPSLEQLSNLIIRGGWPEILNINNIEKASLLSNSYLDTLVKKDIKKFGNKNSKTLMMIIKSLARNESTIVSNSTIINDCFESENINNISRITLETYLDILRNLHILVEDESFEINIRSSKKVGKSPKRHLVDPSLSCAALSINSKMLLSDVKTLGFMFEALVERDLRIYAQSIEGTLKHFRDNSSGLELDAIIELKNGDYGIFEIKLGFNGIEEAKTNILKFRKNVHKKPLFSCIIIGLLEQVLYDVENDIYIVPITALKPY